MGSDYGGWSVRMTTDPAHQEYHKLTIDTLQSVEGLLSEIAIISNAMLAVFVVASIAILWTLHKK